MAKHFYVVWHMNRRALLLTSVLIVSFLIPAFAQKSKQDQDVLDVIYKNPKGEVIPREYRGYKLGTSLDEYHDLYFNRSLYDSFNDVPAFKIKYPFKAIDRRTSIITYSKIIYEISWEVAYNTDVNTLDGLVQAAKEKYKYIRESSSDRMDGSAIESLEDELTTMIPYYNMSRISIIIRDNKIESEYLLWVDYFSRNPDEYYKWKAKSLLPK